MIKKRYKLINIISSDLISHDKLSLFILILVLHSAMLVVIITHYTRHLTDQREQMVLEQNFLNIEWRNLVLEDNVLEYNSAIQWFITKKLQMQYVDTLQENIIIQS